MVTLTRRLLLFAAGLPVLGRLLHIATPGDAGPLIPPGKACALGCQTACSGHLRTAEVMNDHGEWERRPFAELRKGDVFRLYEEDGQVVDAGTKYEVMVATSDALPPGPRERWSSIQCDFLPVRPTDQSA